MGIVLHDRLQGLADRMVTEASEWASELANSTVQPSELAGAYAPFHDIVRRVGFVPDPADFDAEISRLDSVVTNLGPKDGPAQSAPGGRSEHFDDYTPPRTLGLMNSVEGRLQEWRGETASEFRKSVVTPFQTSYARNQWTMATVLRESLTAMKAVWQGQADLIVKIAEEHVNALQSRGTSTWTAASDDSSSFDLGIADVAGLLVGVASLVLAPPTGGGSIALTAAGFGTGLLGGYGYDSGQPEYGVPNASNPEGVMESLEVNVDLFCRTTADAERLVADFLQGVLDQAYDNPDLFGYRSFLDTQHGTHTWTHEGGWSADATT